MTRGHGTASIGPRFIQQIRCLERGTLRPLLTMSGARSYSCSAAPPTPARWVTHGSSQWLPKRPEGDRQLWWPNRSTIANDFRLSVMLRLATTSGRSLLPRELKADFLYHCSIDA